MDDYINQLMQMQGVTENVDPEVRAELFADLQQRAVDFMNRRLLDAMDDTTVDEFQKLLDSNPTDPAVVQKFIEERVPNRDQVATDALIEFRNLFLGEKA
jgi:hypothetical protein